MLSIAESEPRIKVSVIPRLVAALSFAIPAIGAAFGSLLMIRMFRILAENETAGISAIMGGMKEAALPVTISFYLAAICGLAVIVLVAGWVFAQTKSAAPPIWFFVIGVILCLVPAGLFWKAQALIIEALSPGSSTSVNGVAAAGADVSQLLMLSVIAAPIVIVLLIIASVLPLSTRSKAKWLPLSAAAVSGILIIAVAAAFPFLVGEPQRQNEIVNLPSNISAAAADPNIDKESSVVLTVTADDKLYERQVSGNKVERAEKIIDPNELPEKIRALMDGASPYRRIVYLKGDVNASFENVVKVFHGIRKAEIDKVGLVVVGAKNEDDPYQIAPLMLEVKLPSAMNETDEPVRPNPLMLVAVLAHDGGLRLNSEDTGSISDTANLEERLREIFKAREMNGVFRVDTYEIEKTLFVKVSKSCKYGDFIKLVAAMKRAGVQPIGVQIDDLSL